MSRVLLLLLLQEDVCGRVFHTVLVVTDRLQLDQQLGDTLAAFMAGGCSGDVRVCVCVGGVFAVGLWLSREGRV